LDAFDITLAYVCPLNLRTDTFTSFTIMSNYGQIYMNSLDVNISFEVTRLTG